MNIQLRAGPPSGEAIKALPDLKRAYPSLILPDGAIQALLEPPSDPNRCTFARVSVNYSADLRTRVNPCFFGGKPDCSQCAGARSAPVSTGCTSAGSWLALKAGALIDATLAAGRPAPRPYQG